MTVSQRTRRAGMAVPYCAFELRAPWGQQHVTDILLFRRCDTGEGLPDHFRHPGLDPVELLKPVNNVHELLKRLDLLPLEHVPANGRQIETPNGSRAGIIKTRHWTLPTDARSGLPVPHDMDPGIA